MNRKYQSMKRFNRSVMLDDIAFHHQMYRKFEKGFFTFFVYYLVLTAVCWWVLPVIILQWLMSFLKK